MILQIPIPVPDLADAMARMRSWLDERHCTPILFATKSVQADTVLIRVEFADSTDAAAFRTAFAGGGGQTQAAVA